jgi:hypothetical protein
VLGQRILEETIAEWWSGLDASGVPSRFAQHVDRGGLVGRQLVRDTALLQAMLCRVWGGDNRVSVRIAVGADGEPDVRIELADAKGGTRVQRWRPSDGDLDPVIDQGQSVARSWRPAVITAHAARVESVLAAGPAAMGLADTHPAIETLKAERFELLEMLEAGADRSLRGIGGYLDLVETKLATIRARHNVLHRERKAKTQGAVP